MKKKILGAACGALFLFGASFSTSIENSIAAAVDGPGDKKVINVSCKGSDGHCFEYKGTTYYGKAYGTDAE